MRKGHRTIAAVPVGYMLPEDAHLALIQTRDQLRLMARLIEPGIDADDERTLSSTALAHCFERLAHDLDGVVEVARWSAPGADVD
jgi:hypothetical protein